MPHPQFIVSKHVSQNGMCSVVLLWSARRILTDTGTDECIGCAFSDKSSWRPTVDVFNAFQDTLEAVQTELGRRPMLQPAGTKSLSLDEAYLLSAFAAAQVADLKKAATFLAAFLGEQPSDELLERMRALGWLLLLRGQLIFAPRIGRYLGNGNFGS